MPCVAPPTVTVWHTVVLGAGTGTEAHAPPEEFDDEDIVQLGQSGTGAALAPMRNPLTSVSFPESSKSKEMMSLCVICCPTICWHTYSQVCIKYPCAGPSTLCTSICVLPS